MCACLGYLDAATVMARYFEPSERGQRNGSLALHYGAAHGHANVVKMLLDLDKKTVDEENDDKQTPLHLAAFYGNVDAVKMLLQYNAKVDPVDKDNKTALELAVQEGHEDVAEILRVAKKRKKETPAEARSTKKFKRIVDKVVDEVRARLKNNTQVPDVKQEPTTRKTKRRR